MKKILIALVTTVISINLYAQDYEFEKTISVEGGYGLDSSITLTILNEDSLGQATVKLENLVDTAWLKIDTGVTTLHSTQPIFLDSESVIVELPTYADDATAGAGGLVAGQLYKTASGEVRIKL